MSDLKPKKVSDSVTTITELMIPSYANFGGKIHGGILLSLMDKVAYACATRHAGTYCVTVTVDRVEFLQPVEVGELVSLTASVHYVGRTSMIIGIRVESQNVKNGTIKHTNTSFFTMVAKGDDNKPAVVPELILTSTAEVDRFLDGLRLKSLRERVRKEMEADAEVADPAQAGELLKNERCILSLES